MTIRLQVIEDLCLGFQDAVSGFQKLQMAQADIGDHTGIRPRDFSQAVHFSEVADSHFQDRDLMLRAQAENGQRNSQFIVEISFCL